MRSRKRIRRKKGPLGIEGAFSGQLQFYDVHSLGAFRALFNIKADFVTFSETLEAIALD